MSMFIYRDTNKHFQTFLGGGEMLSVRNRPTDNMKLYMLVTGSGKPI